MNRFARRIVAVVATCIAFLLATAVPASATQAWSPAVTISNGSINGAGESVQFAVGPDNFVAATWSHFENSIYTIQVSVSHDVGQTWSTPVTISETDGHTEGPHVAINGSGAIMVAWGSEPVSPWYTRYSVSVDQGQTWSPYGTISDTNFSSATNSLVAVGDHGFAVLMSQTDGSRGDVVARSSSDDGTSWSSFTTLSDAVHNSYFFDLAVDSSDNLAAVWLSDLGGQWEIQSSSSQDGGLTWALPTGLNAGVEAQYPPQVLDGGSGAFVAVWESISGVTHSLLASRGTSSGQTWSAPATIASNVGSFPQLTSAIGPDGKLVVVWSEEDSGTRTLYSMVSSDGGETWGSPAVVADAEMGSTFPLYRPRVAVMSNGTILVGWTNAIDLPGNLNSVQVAMSSDGISWGEPTTISPAGASDVNVATTSDAQAIVGWVQRLDDQGNSVAIQSSSWLTPQLPNTGRESDASSAALVALTLVSVGATAITLARRHQRTR